MQVTISTGVVAGTAPVPGVWAYRGIPYAAAERFGPPLDPAPWTGVRDGSRPGPSAWQSTSPAPRDLIDLAVAAESEDCLSVDVWTPATAPGDRLAVLVFIHGGAWLTGSGSLAAYDGARLAARGVVVVNINYRLGIFGWLRAPSLGTSGNEGLADQIAALTWVQREIAAFGGDPTNVTVFGESAGAGSIAAHLAAGRGGSLFARAILQSGAHDLCQSVAEAERQTATMAEALAARSLGWDDLRRLPAAELIALQQDALPRRAGMWFRPVSDGGLAPADLGAALAGGAAAGVPVLAGSNREEIGFFWGRDPALDTVAEESLPALVAAWTDRGSELAAAYRAARARRGATTDTRAVAVAIASDGMFRRGVIELAEAQVRHASAHVYLFDWRSPLYDGLVGAAHVLDLPFVFGTHRSPQCAPFVGDAPEADALSDAMRNAWVAFARSGDPGWPRYDTSHRPTRVRGPGCPVVDDPDGEELRAWDLVGAGR